MITNVSRSLKNISDKKAIQQKKKCLTKMNRAFLLVLQRLFADYFSVVCTWKWAQERTKGILTCIIDGQVCKSSIKPANGGAQSWAAGAGLSKISVDTEAVAIGYCNTLPRIFKLMVRRCFYNLSTKYSGIARYHYSVNQFFVFVIFLFLLLNFWICWLDRCNSK